MLHEVGKVLNRAYTRLSDEHLYVYQYPTFHHLAPEGFVGQLVAQSHQRCDCCGFDSHLSLEIFSLQINLRTRFECEHCWVVHMSTTVHYTLFSVVYDFASLSTHSSEHNWSTIAEAMRQCVQLACV